MADINDALEAARAQRALIDFVNVHFTRLPDDDFVKLIRSNGFRATLATLAEDTEADRDMASGARLMLDYIDATRDVEVALLLQELGVDRTRLYRGVTPGYGAPYPAEAVWRNLDDRRASRLLEELTVLYRAQGAALREDARERADYLGAQLEYAAFVTERAVEALETNDEAAAESCQEAVGLFAAKHLDWVDAFIADANPRAETDFYRGHMLMLSALCHLLASDALLAEEAA